MVMDSNMRIDSDSQDKHFKTVIAGQLEVLSGRASDTLLQVAVYLESPYTSPVGWRGDLALRVGVLERVERVKREIEHFVSVVVDEVHRSDSVREQEPEETVTAVEGIALGYGGGATETSRKHHIDYRSLKPQKMRQRLGDTINSWHKIYPMRSFCTLAVQCAMQSCSLALEVVTFMDGLEDGAGMEGGESCHVSSLHQAVYSPIAHSSASEAGKAGVALSSQWDSGSGGLGVGVALTDMGLHVHNAGSDDGLAHSPADLEKGMALGLLQGQGQGQRDRDEHGSDSLHRLVAEMEMHDSISLDILIAKEIASREGN